MSACTHSALLREVGADKKKVPSWRQRNVYKCSASGAGTVALGVVVYRAPEIGKGSHRKYQTNRRKTVGRATEEDIREHGILSPLLLCIRQ
mmetsp:Transcript_19709/g.50455  ORF Transcript_19709/g.50455 Transcript_19709/m.50455 type:complete len:91 (-) Transcript_19709:588-860(-)